MDKSTSIVQLIQLMLAPGIMISACGLLLLGINNKYSIVVNRIRLLNQERRTIRRNLDTSETALEDNVRLESTAQQIEMLYNRIKLIRNTVLSYSIAIALFVVTSLLIGFAYFWQKDFNIIIIVTFLAGIIAVLCGAIFTGIETSKGYKIISFEIKAEE